MTDVSGVETVVPGGPPSVTARASPPRVVEFRQIAGATGGKRTRKR